jgi:DNA-binding response OmpR family regulator
MLAPILFVEDNSGLATAVARGLTEDGFEVLHESTGAGALRELLARDVSAVILDLGLPDMDGMAVLQQARVGGFRGPILILTARDAVASRVAGLEAGADDYLVKPFAFAELLARLRALLRRTGEPRRSGLSFTDLVLKEDTLGALVDGRYVALSPREHALLEFLAHRRGDVLNRTEILRQVFGYNFDPGTNIVDVHVAHLRRKLGASAALLETVRGMGYRLREPFAHGS